MIRKCTALLLALLLVFATLPSQVEADVLTENLPEVLGNSYAIVDASNGEILYGKSYDSAVDPGAFAQVMTAILMIESDKLSDEVTVPEIPTDVNTGNKVYLREGEKVRMSDLLEAIIVYNANDAAHAAAIHMAGDQETFVKKMNEKAEELGMDHTTFLSPYTSKDGQTSTAQDIAIMAAYASELEEYLEYANQQSMSWNSDAWNKEDIANSNQFLYYDEDGYGVMLNSRGEQYDLAAGINKQGRNLVGVILGETEETMMYDEMVALLDYGMTYTHTQSIVRKDQAISTLVFGENKVVRVAAKESFSMITPTSEDANVTHNAVYQNISLPIREGDEIGTLKIYQGDEVVKEIPLVALDSARGSINWWTVIASVLAIIYLASIIYRLVQQGHKRRTRTGRKSKNSSSWTAKIPRPGGRTPSEGHPAGPGTQNKNPQGYQKGRKPTAEGKRQLEQKLEAKRQQRRPDDRR